MGVLAEMWQVGGWVMAGVPACVPEITRESGRLAGTKIGCVSERLFRYTKPSIILFGPAKRNLNY